MRGFHAKCVKMAHATFPSAKANPHFLREFAMAHPMLNNASIIPMPVSQTKKLMKILLCVLALFGTVAVAPGQGTINFASGVLANTHISTNSVAGGPGGETGSVIRQSEFPV